MQNLGKDKELILQYLKISLLFERENSTLECFFHFLNKNFHSISSFFLPYFHNIDDLTNINELNKAYNEEILLSKKGEINLLFSGYKQIKIVSDEEIKKKRAKIKRNKK